MSAKPVAGPGRRTALDDRLIAEIAEDVRRGSPPLPAIVRRNVATRTATEWLQRGRGEHPSLPAIPPYSTLAAAIEQAEADWHSATVYAISADQDWRAKHAVLAARYPETYREKQNAPAGQADAVRSLFEALAQARAVSQPPNEALSQPEKGKSAGGGSLMLPEPRDVPVIEAEWSEVERPKRRARKPGAGNRKRRDPGSPGDGTRGRARRGT